MLKPWIVLIVLVALAACGRSTPGIPTPAATAPVVAPGPAFSGSGATASGEILPQQEAQLGFTVPGRVDRVEVAVEDRVVAGEVLASLETASLQAGVAQAQAALDAARANQDRVSAGARPEEVGGAEQMVATSQAHVAQAEAGLQAAEAQHAVAQAAIRAAQAAVEASQANLRQLQSGPRQEEMAAAKADLNLAEAQVRQAQAGYDRVKAAADIQMRPEALALEQASIACDAARARYQAVLRGASDDEVHAAAAQVEAAQALLAQRRDQAVAAQAQVTQAASAVEAAKAEQAQAEQRLSLLEAGATAEEMAAAQAQVAQAEAALRAAQAVLDQGTLRAPFAGTITSVEISPGETVAPGQTVLALADLSRLRVATTDLSERDVARVQEGQPAVVYVEALGTQIEGRVTTVAPCATTIGGDVVYTVWVDLTEQLPGLRWGMSADVQFTAESPVSSRSIDRKQAGEGPGQFG